VRKLSHIIWGTVLGILAAQMASGNEPYLSSVGPSPLRFEFTGISNPLFLAKLVLPKLGETNATAIATPPTAGTNTAPTTGLAGAAPGKNSAGNFLDTAKIAEDAANPASDLLSITPQMINQYFQPNRVEGPGQFQPGDTIMVPAELGFVPPIPAGSRAIYISR
jgi:hypothetical protein